MKNNKFVMYQKKYINILLIFIRNFYLIYLIKLVQNIIKIIDFIFFSQQNKMNSNN